MHILKSRTLMQPSTTASSQNLKLRNRALLYAFVILTGLLYALSFIRVERQKWSTALNKQIELDQKREALKQKKEQQSLSSQNSAA